MLPLLLDLMTRAVLFALVLTLASGCQVQCTTSSSFPDGPRESARHAPSLNGTAPDEEDRAPSIGSDHHPRETRADSNAHLGRAPSRSALTARAARDERATAPAVPRVDTARQEPNQSIDRTRRTAITRAVQEATPAVVSINVLGTRRVPIDPWFQHFFGRGGPSVERQVQSVGSGFVISPDGYVVTNQHVVSLGQGRNRISGRRITVSFPDGRELEAEVVGADAITDLALLRVESEEPLPHLSFGSSAEVIVGEWVIALGNPFGLFQAAEPSVTVGVVSARNRNFEAQEGRVYRDMIQTDAAINKGNSGGPLINALGEVIGVNTFIISAGSGSGSVGVGFATPADKAERIIAELREYGEVRRSFNIGVSTRPMNARIAEALNLQIEQGLLVDRVSGNSPAEKAGIQPYDVIVSIGNEEVSDRGDAIAALAEYRVGDEVPVTVIRRGEKLNLALELEGETQSR